MQTMLRKKILTVRQFDNLAAYLDKQPCCAEGKHTFAHTVKWMRKHEVSDVQANIEKFVDQMAMCDCEVLELDDEEWGRKREQTVSGQDIHGAAKWQATILELLFEAG